MAAKPYFSIEIYCGKGGLQTVAAWREWEKYDNLDTCRRRRKIILEQEPNADRRHVRICRVHPLDLPEMAD